MLVVCFESPRDPQMTVWHRLSIACDVLYNFRPRPFPCQPISAEASACVLPVVGVHQEPGREIVGQQVVDGPQAAGGQSPPPVRGSGDPERAHGDEDELVLRVGRSNTPR